MNRVILFSPVGGSDPMPQTNFRDGSLLHICRVYQPSEVYLYMSAEILQLHKDDDRYLYCLRRLEELQNRKMEYKIIERPELRSVQFFDTFYQDFREIIKKISEGMDDTDQLLLNVSSGTPAMKSGLVVLATLGEYPYQLIQVSTPTGRMNEHRHGNYDVETMWELNEDNDASKFENRCREVYCPSLSLMKQEEIIKRLVDSYDYEAANRICDMLPEQATRNYNALIDFACARLRLDLKRAEKLDKALNMSLMPVKDSSKMKIFEYMLGICVKQKKGEYTDFIRAITPLIVSLFKAILKFQCKIDIDRDYSLDWEGKRWDRKRLKGTEIEDILQEKYDALFQYKDIYSVHLVHIIKTKCATDTGLCESVETMRRIEERVRNPAAHELVSLSDEDVKKMTKGYDTKNIIKILKKLFHYAGFGIREDAWQAYETMNEVILRRMRH